MEVEPKAEDKEGEGAGKETGNSGGSGAAGSGSNPLDGWDLVAADFE